MNSLKAVIFDMDGVLSDSEPIYHLSINQVLRRHGYEVTEEVNKEILGTTVEYSWSWLKSHFDLKGDIEDWIDEYDAVVVENLKEKVVPAPGVYDLLEKIKSSGLHIGLASSSQGNWVHALLSTLGIENNFDVVVSGEMVKQGKPHPEIFLQVAKKLKVDPSYCLVIEDSPHGIKAAKSAKMKVVAVLTPYTKDLNLSGADQVIESLKHFDYNLLDSTLPAK